MNCAKAREDEASVLKEIGLFLEKVEISWRQRAKDIRLSEGDPNTSFFYARTTSRQKQNQVKGSLDTNNV